MLAFLAALLVAGQPAAPSSAAALGRTAWIFSTVGHSEWCPAGNVKLDLGTGRYAFTATAPRRTCNDAGLERPIRTGTLEPERLAAVRAAYLRARSDGLTNPACRDGGRPKDIVIDNGGTPVLVLTSGAETGSAPDDLSCWSEAAGALHDVLDDLFSSARWP
jgi:hypothetical protein